MGGQHGEEIHRQKTGDKIELHSGEPAGPLSAYLDPEVLSECMALIDAVE